MPKSERDPLPGTSARDFPRKLRLAMRVAGCATQKDMHARLMAVNPNTAYEPSRAYKWTQGRSTPRDLSVYDDLARLLDLPVTGDVLRRCGYEEYRRLMEARHGAAVPAEAVDAPTQALDTAPVPGYLAGSYLTLSRSWSVHRGPRWLIAGAMTIQPDGSGGITVDYVEELPGGPLVMAGALQRTGRCLHALLTSREHEMLIAMTYTLPMAPALLLSGVMSGVTLHDAEMRAAACRVVALRVPQGGDSLRSYSGYVDGTAAAVAERLVLAGFAPGLAGQLAPGVLAFATGPAEQGLLDAPASGSNALVGLMLADAG